MKIFWMFMFLVLAAANLGAVPLPVTDLRIEGSLTGFRHIVLNWTTPLDIDASTETYREIRVSTIAPIVSDTDWDNNSGATSYPYRITWSTTGAILGGLESETVTGLSNSQIYFFAIKTSTDNISWSALDSSSPEPFGSAFNTVPAVVGGHNLTTGTIANTATPLLSWNVPVAGLNTDDEIYGDSISQYTLEFSKFLDYSIKSTIEGIGTNSWITTPLDENDTYYWRVKGEDSEGLLSTTYLSQSTRYFRVNAVNEAPQQFGIISPVNNQIEIVARPLMQWNASNDQDPDDSITYEVYYSTRNDFAVEFTTIVTGISITQYQPSHDLIENAGYYWKAYAVDESALATISLATGTFRINSFNEAPLSFSPDGPADTSMIYYSSATLSWLPASDPDPGDTITYSVIYSSSDPLLSTEYVSSTSIITTQLPLLSLEEDATYWWKVQAVDTGSFMSQTSVWSFFVNAVNSQPSSFNLLSSSGSVSTALPSFAWENSTDPDGDAVNYTILYSTDAGFNVFNSSGGLTVSSYTPQSALSENAIYYWKVRSFDIYLSSRTSNQIWPLMIDAVNEPPTNFTLSAPADQSKISLAGVSLDWEDSSDPDPEDYLASYELYFSTAVDFSIQTAVPGIIVSSFTLLGPFSNNTTYYWKIKAVSAFTGETLSDATWQFYTGNIPPASFNLTASSGIISTASPLLDWEDPIDAEGDILSFAVFLSSYANFSTFITSAGLSSSEYTVSGLNENKTYYWYAAADDGTNSAVQSSQIWEIIINAVAEAPQTFNLLSPHNNEVFPVLKPDLDWEDSSDPDPGETVSFTLWYSKDPAFSIKTVVSGLAVSSHTIVNELENNSTYYWCVFAQGETLPQCQSSVWQFAIVATVKPLNPENFTAVQSLSGKEAVFSWDAVTKNEAGVTLTNLQGYRVYKAYDQDTLFTVSAATEVGAGVLSWTDENIGGQVVYYMVKAFDSYYVESVPTRVQQLGTETLTLLFSEDRTLILSLPPAVLLSTITFDIVRNNGEEQGSILRSYSVQARNPEGEYIEYVFSSAVKLSFRMPDGVSVSARKAQSVPPPEVGIFWNNGVEWVSLGGDKSGGFLLISSPKTGAYQMRSISRSAEFKVLMCWPKIITPNGDSINDSFNYTFENPQGENVEGAVFDITGGKIAEMDIETTSWITWDGRSKEGATVSTGIYIYQVRCGTKVYNGTVTVAR